MQVQGVSSRFLRICGILTLLVAASGATGVGPEVAMAQQEAANLVRDGSFEVATDKQLPSSWTTAGSVRSIGVDPVDHTEGNISLKLEGTAGQGLRLAQDVEVEPRSELLFTASVKSNDRVVATIRDVRMSYHRQGEWQTLVGLIRTGEESKLTIAFDVAGLSKKRPVARFDAVTLRKLTRPTSLKRRFDVSTTVLIEAGKAHGTIVYPSSIPLYKSLAEWVQKAIADRGGVTLPIVSDVEATEAASPILKPEFAGQNLILIGRLGLNRAMWPAYNRFLDATDGYYPGGEGYVVRTAANVLRNGRNHLILGGSTEAGARRAVEKFIEIVGSSLLAEGKLSLPWLLDVQLDGACLAAVKRHDQQWVDNDPKLPPIEPGYGTVRRWYENAMGYYWTGWDSYRERAVALLEPVLQDRAYSHHYVMEFFVRTFDMIDDGPLLSAEQRKAVEELFVSNFCDFCTDAGDASWMTAFSPPYDTIQLVNRHQIAPWMSDLTLADFLHDYFEPAGDLGKLAAFRQSEKEAFMRHLVTERWDASLPGGVSTEHEEEIALSMLRFALDRQVYEMFTSNNAREALLLERINHLGGNWVRPGGRMDSKLILGTLASYYQDGRYLTLMDKLQSGPPFMRRYLGGVRTYMPGAEVVPQEVDSFTGVRLPTMTPNRRRHLHSLQGAQFQEVKFPASEVFDFASFRSGFDPNDDYVAINGLVGPGFLPGVFLSFASRGMNWLGAESAEQYDAGADRYFERNGVHVLRSDRWSSEAKPYAAAAKLDWSADLHRAGGVSFTCDPFVETRWGRSVVWIRPGLYVVRDQVSSKTSGKFEIVVNWRPAGGPAWDGKTWTSTARAGTFRLTPIGEGFTVQQNVDAFLAGDAKLYLRHTASPTLQVGESVAAMAVLQALDPLAEAGLLAEQVGKDALLLSADQQPGERTLVAWGPLDLRGAKSDAQVIVVRPGVVQMIAGTQLDIGGKPVFRSEKPLAVMADFNAGKLFIDNPQRSGPQRLEVVGGKPLDVPVGAAQLDLPKAPSELLTALRVPLDQATRTTVADRETAPTKAAASEWTVQDQTNQWKQTWQYDGLQQPMPVRRVTAVADGVADLGRVVDIAEIRTAAITSGPWFVRSLPELIWTSLGDESGNMPALDSPAWTKIEQAPEWIVGVRTGNYGETGAIEKDAQILRFDNLKARYVRAAGAERLVYLDRQQPGSYLPLKLQLTGESANQKIFVTPRIWPKFVGWLPHWPDKVAMLSPDGKQIFNFSSPQKILDVQLLPVDDSGAVAPVIATVDARILTLGPDGSIARELNFMGMHEEYNKTFGRPNTRHPSGGFSMPFAIGAWRQDPSAGPGMVVARYHSFSFIDDSGRLEGLLAEGMYVQPALLPSGIDFDGDGAQEQVCLGRGQVFQVHGPKDERVVEPTGFLFFPQIYHVKRLDEPAWDERIDGPAVVLMQPVTTGRSAPTRPRHVAIVRENYVGVYDGLENKWAFTWVPAAPVRAAAVVEDAPRRLRLLVTTDDGLLWDLGFGDSFERPASFSAGRFPDVISAISADASQPGRALLAGHHGLYRLAGKEVVEKIASGPFVDVCSLAGGQPAILAVGRDARVIRLDPVQP